MAKVVENKEYKVELIDPKTIKVAPYNPRKFNSKTFERIKRELEIDGMLEHLIVNKRTMHIVHGNQRYKAMVSLNWKAVPVRFIDVNEEDEKRLNITMNNLSMENEQEKLAFLMKELEHNKTVQEILADLLEKQKEMLKEKGLTPEMEFARELDEKYNYVVFVFDKGTDFINVQTMFNLKPVFDPVKNKKVSMGRVIDGKLLLKKLNGR